MDFRCQSERETYRVIVFGQGGTEILLSNSEAGFVLPTVKIPRYERIAEHLTSAVKKELACEAVCLFSPSCPAEESTSNGERYEVMECWRDGKSVNGQVWRAVRSLSEDSFLFANEFQRIQHCLSELEEHESRSPSSFARRGWFGELRDWAAQVIHPLGLELTDSFRQYNASPTFSLVRFETNGPAIWFKAVGEPNLHEFSITMKLEELFPRFMPRIVGKKPQWNGWLALEAEGMNLSETNDIAWWEQAAADLARLQVESIASAEVVLRLGAHDLRFDALFGAIEPFFGVVARLMDEQPRTPPAALTREGLNRLRLVVDDAVTLLADLPIPSALGHLDLNPGNILTSAHGSIFLDWAEAYLGSPFFSLEYLLRHFRRQLDMSATGRARIVDAYQEPWRQFASNDHISDALGVTPLAAVFAYASGLTAGKNEARLRDPKIAGYMRSLTRTMNREATLLQGRCSCPS